MDIMVQFCISQNIAHTNCMGRDRYDKSEGGAKATHRIVSQVVLYELPIVFAQFQRVGHLVEAHPSRHEFLDVFQ